MSANERVVAEPLSAYGGEAPEDRGPSQPARILLIVDHVADANQPASTGVRTHPGNSFFDAWVLKVGPSNHSRHQTPAGSCQPQKFVRLLGRGYRLHDDGAIDAGGVGARAGCFNPEGAANWRHL